MYLLDTNIISELRRNRPHPAVLSWLKDVKDSDLHVSAVTIGELQAGVEKMRRQDIEKALVLESWLDRIEATFNILTMDGRTFRIWGKLMQGQPTEIAIDALVAATAEAHGLTVVTRNVRDFERLAIRTLNPFDFQRP